MTDNRNRTVSDVRHAFSKFGGNLGTDGSVSYLFNKLGLIHISKEYTDEKIMELVIESGAVDYTEEDEFFEVITDANDFNNVLETFKQKSVVYINAQLTFRAETYINIDQEMSEKVINIMEFMDNLDDVQEVHTNAEFTENFETKG